MSILLDTSVLVALKGVNADKQLQVQQAIRLLDAKGWQLCIAPQILMEYWSVATRPASARGGLGLTISEANEDVAAFVQRFHLLLETESLFPTWWGIVRDYDVSGRQVWDARIAALMRQHNVLHLLTFNVGDFRRFDFLYALEPNALPLS